MPKRKVESSQASRHLEQVMDNNNKMKQEAIDMKPDLSQPPTKRLRVPLNFSIESIMQTTSHHQQQQQQQQQQQHHGANNYSYYISKSSQPLQAVVSRSPSPATSDASTRSGSSNRSSGRTSTGTLGSNRNENLGNRFSSSGSKHHNMHDTESFASSRSSSRVSSPISPGCNSAEIHSSRISHNNNNNHHQHQHHHHNHRSNGHTNHNHPALAQSPTTTASYKSAGGRHQRPGTSSTRSATAATNTTASATATSSSSCSANSRLNQVECVLDNKDMWDKFHSLNTEMIITKTGRRMFPVLKVQFQNLDPNARYAVSMDIVPVDNKRYRYAYHKSSWQEAGKADPSAEPRLYPHPDSPFNGDLLSRQVISFEKVKLTNNEMDKSGHIILNSMHKYQPRVHLIELKSTLPPPESQTPVHLQQQQQQQIPTLSGKMSHSPLHHQQQYQNSRQQQQQQQQQPQPQLDIEGYRTFVFPETVFTAVTAYQNQLITKMKIDKNPFAKGFRDSSRLSDLDRNDPFDYMSSLGPAAAAAAAACAAGRFSAGPPGGPPLPSGSLEAAAAAVAAAGLPPGHQGQMDQAYAQLLASAAAANSPWYSAAAAAAANPFGPMGASCSTTQAAQQLQATQMWLAAFSACLNNGGGQPNSAVPRPPPLSAGQISNEPLETNQLMQQQQQHECRGDSRGSG